jgi:DNA-3-methyladenine glycosylase
MDVMQQRRTAARRPQELTNGPGKLTQAFGIDDAFHGTMLTKPPLFFAPAEEGAPAFEVATSSRIGISKGVDRPWRFFVADHPYVSPGTPSDQT